MIFLIRALCLILCIALGVGFFYDTLHTVFVTNLIFNGFIAGAWLVGLAYLFTEFYRLFYEEKRFGNASSLPVNALLFPILQLKTRSCVSSDLISSALENVRRRLEDRVQMARYIASSLIFLGLLGTLWGLSETIVQIADVIGHLPTSSPEDTFFSLLKDQLKKPLSGMGIAFGSSLFGLSGSLTLSFIELQLSKAQEALCYRIEAWTSQLQEQTSVSAGTVSSGDSRPRKPIETEDLYAALMMLNEKTNQWIELMKAQHGLLGKWIDEQSDMRHTLEGLRKKMHDFSLSGDEVAKGYLNQISVTCRELLKRLTVDQGGITETLRQEIKGLAEVLDRK
jgi:hypothetical protein